MPQWIAACQTGDVDPEDVIPFEHGGQDYVDLPFSPNDRLLATDLVTEERHRRPAR